MAEATDTSERGLERLICTALAGHPCDPRKEGRAAEAPAGYGGVGWIGGSPHDYDREFCVDRIQLAAFLHATQPEAAESLALHEDGPTRRKFLARLQGEISKRGTIDVLRHGIKHGAHDLDLFYGTPSPGNPQAQRTLRAEPLHRRPPASLQRRRHATGARHQPVHQRPARLHLRAEEQPHEADGGRCGRAVQEGPQPAREAVRAGPLRGPLRRRRERGALLHAPHGQGLLVPAVQPRLERWRRQPAQPERYQDRLSVAPGAGPREPDQHPGELRPGGGGEGREDPQEEADAGLAPLPPARRRAPAAGRRRGARGGPAAT